MLWLVSAFVGALSLHDWSEAFSEALGISALGAGSMLILACIADVVVALLLLRRWKPRRMALAQVLLIGGYTTVATILWPFLWGEALGPLVKNIPIVMAVLALGAIEEER